MRPCTIAVYVQAVRNAQLEHGFDDPTVDSWLPKRVLKGIQRCHGVEIIKPRLPITMPILRKLIDACRQCRHMTEYDRLLYQAALLLAFYGFLRCAEFTSNLAKNCIEFESGSMRVLLRKSKTDPFGKGVYVDIGSATSPYCPVRAMLAYLSTSRHLSLADPLFVLSSGKPLTRAAVTDTVRCLLKAANVPSVEMYSGHSFRIGAATTAAVAGVPDSLIRTAGRWKSDSCLHYMRLPVDMKRHLSKQLASVQDV